LRSAYEAAIAKPLVRDTPTSRQRGLANAPILSSSLVNKSIGDMSAMAAAVLDRLEVPQHPNVFVLGAFASRLTFNAQQTRAFNLMWALGATHRVTPGTRVAVVGGGVAGLTVAAAACSKGCRVTIYERHSDVLGLQRGNYVRHIHPNVLDWPYASSARRSMDLPFLGWTSGTVDQVVYQLEAEWARFANHITVWTRHEVISPVTPRDGKAYVQSVSLEQPTNDLPAEEYDVVVLAVGFGLERTLERVPGRSYWQNDSLHQEVPFAPAVPKRVLVSGCGDGGLIDALRLCLRRFEHEAFVEDLLTRDDLEPAKERLRTIDQAASTLPADAVPAFLAEEYDKLREVLPGDFLASLFARVRRDVRVVLNGGDATPLSLRASILNRFAIHLLCSAGHLDYRQGVAGRVSGSTGAYFVNFERANGHWVVESFDDVIVRHGPIPVINALLPREALKALADRWVGPDPTLTRSLWTADDFPPVSETARVPDERIAHARLPEAVAALLTPKIAALRVGRIDDRVGFIVTQARAIPEAERVSELYGLPVRYITLARLSDPPDVDPSWDTLQIGSLIGRGASAEHPNRRPTSGTLGCFVRSENGRIGLVTACDNLDPRCLVVGAPIVQVDTFRMRQQRDVGIVRRFVDLQPSPIDSHPVRSDVVLNTMDVALVDLNTDVDYRPTFPARYGLPPLVGVAAPRPGDEVFKVGGRTGMTRGRIISVDGVTVWTESGNPLWMRSVIVIESFGETRFAHAGDSGAILVRHDQDGAWAVGMIYGTDRQQYHYAFALAPALEAMACEILSSTARPNGA
jgi:hypothetical protein